MINGKPRKLVSTAARNGYFFTLDRVTGEHLVTSKYGTATNWVKGLRQERVGAARSATRIRRSAARSSRRRRWHDQLGAARLHPRHRPLLRGRAQRLLALLPDRTRSARLDGPRRQSSRRTVGSAGSFLTAIDHKTGKIAWREQYPAVGEGGGGGGLLTTAGGLVFAGDAGGNIVAYDATHGEAALALAHRQRHATRRRPTCSTAASTCSSRPATCSTRSSSTIHRSHGRAR